ncbi:phosphate regulon transcriptional regulator PhoB [Salaquimonas pukyongi]|uniref:phosphate regulon transcriptional regulator PhoB n=1 Tax=Salaquimonas pukyongi TaxID=2712698 RepID=UPI001966DADD|nr:phosphate regulon transcriptional regulator PhoB [Salaquimonas pukyongi]
MVSTEPPLVLIVEDEPAQTELLRYNFDKTGFRTITAADGEEGVLLARERRPDLIVLDWMLPELSGIEVCRQLKRDAEVRQIPVMMLTARGEETDKVRGLDTGADDYVVKPYSVNELLARARALLRRANPASMGETLVHGDLVLDQVQHKVIRNSKPVKLGPTEFRLLTVLMERPGRVWSRGQLLDRVWGQDMEIDYRTVDVHVGRLRKALRQEGKADPIRTVRAAGYSLDYEG